MEQQTHWAGYRATLQNKPAIVSLDLALESDTELSHLLTMTLVFSQLRTDGSDLPTEAELDAIEPLQLRLEGMLERTDVAYAGRVTTQGKRNYYWYGTQQALSAFAENDFAKFSEKANRAVSLAIVEDADWNLYYQTLCPDEEQLNAINNQETLFELAKDGMPMVGCYELAFHFAFEKEENLKACLEELVTEDFELVEEFFSEEDNVFVLTVSRAVELDLDYLNQTTWYLRQTVLEHKGDFDGWGFVEED